MRTRTNLSPNTRSNHGSVILVLASCFLNLRAREEPKPIVIYTSECSCESDRGESRWQAKTNRAEPPNNPIEILARRADGAFSPYWIEPSDGVRTRTAQEFSENFAIISFSQSAYRLGIGNDDTCTSFSVASASASTSTSTSTSASASALPLRHP